MGWSKRYNLPCTFCVVYFFTASTGLALPSLARSSYPKSFSSRSHPRAQSPPPRGRGGGVGRWAQYDRFGSKEQSLLCLSCCVIAPFPPIRVKREGKKQFRRGKQEELKTLYYCCASRVGVCAHAPRSPIPCFLRPGGKERERTAGVVGQSRWGV